jgi:hypothetical protein
MRWRVAKNILFGCAISHNDLTNATITMVLFFSRIHHGEVYQSHRRGAKKAKLDCQQEVAAPHHKPTLLNATVLLQGLKKQKTKL